MAGVSEIARIDDLADQGTEMSTISDKRSDEILKRVGKAGGFTPLHESLKWTVEERVSGRGAAGAENKAWFKD